MIKREIELPGYNATFPNRVYRKDFDIDTSRGKVTASGILILNRFTEPTKNEVVSYLRAVANRTATINSLIEGVPHGLDNISILEKAVSVLPEEVIADLIAGNKYCLDFVRESTPARPIKEEKDKRKYVGALYGILTPEIIDGNFQDIINRGADWYNSALSSDGIQGRGLGYQYEMRILLDDGRLPPRADMEVLDKLGVIELRTSSFLGSDEIDNIKNTVEVLYSGLSTAEHIALLEDNSASVLESATLAPAVVLLRTTGLLLEIMQNRRQLLVVEPGGEGSRDN